MTREALRLLVLALLIAGCSGDPTESDAGFLRANVSGAVDEVYEGTGEFHTGTPGPDRQQFQISSYRGGGEAEPSFALTRWDGGRLAVGSYPLSLVDLVQTRDGPRPAGITFQYFRRVGEYDELFVAESGEVVITRSPPGRVEGTFSFSGMRYCRRQADRVYPLEPPEGPCRLDTGPIPDAPRISVTGSFAAIPHEPGPIELR